MSDAKKEELKRAKRNARKVATEQAKLRILLNRLARLDFLLSTNDPSELTSFELAANAFFVGASWGGGRVSIMRVVNQTGSEEVLTAANSTGPPAPPGLHSDLTAPTRIADLSAIEIEFIESDKAALQDFSLYFRLDTEPAANLRLPANAILPKGRSSATLMRFAVPIATHELYDHLRLNALYYSQQIWMKSDPAVLMMQISDLEYEGKRLIEYMDPAPISAVANYLVFRWTDEVDDDWVEWKKENADLKRVDVDLVALPTGGVFAEAVLGRFNSAEKLDITRFWNWQDSPIPIQAPEIAAIQAGQHDIATVPQIGSLEGPVVSIQNPQALPEPQGMSAILTAMATSDLFRDMSGTIVGAQLADTALRNSSAGASNASNRAGANLANTGALTVETLRALMPLIMAGAGVPMPSNLGNSSASTAGAMVNHGREMDERGVAGGASSVGGSRESSVAVSDDLAHAAATSGGFESQAFNNAAGIPVGLGARLPVDLVQGALAGQTPSDTVPGSASSPAIVGDNGGDLDLGQIVANHINSLTEAHRGLCVEASVNYFTDALRGVGVPSESVALRDPESGENLSIEIPVVASASGVRVSKRALWALWYSVFGSDIWSRLPKVCRGAGPAGALFYADLAKDRKILTSESGWPDGMLPGAVMQLWPSKVYYESLRDGTASKRLGHAPIFINYDLADKKKITVADNSSVPRVLTYPFLGLGFVMAANPSTARLVDFSQ